MTPGGSLWSVNPISQISDARSIFVSIYSGWPMGQGIICECVSSVALPHLLQAVSTASFIRNCLFVPFYFFFFFFFFFFYFFCFFILFFFIFFFFFFV